jgi:prophage regulatory protein
MTAQPTLTIPPLLVDREQAAAALSISERTLEGLVAAGELSPPRKISGKRVGWLYRELQAFAESRPVSDCLPGPGRRRSAPDAAPAG